MWMWMVCVREYACVGVSIICVYFYCHKMRYIIINTLKSVIIIKEYLVLSYLL